MENADGDLRMLANVLNEEGDASAVAADYDMSHHYVFESVLGQVELVDLQEIREAVVLSVVLHNLV